MILIDYSQILITNLVVLNTNLGSELIGWKGKREVRGAVVGAIRGLVRVLAPSYGTPVLCCDRRSWRRDVFPDYKVARRVAGDPQGIKKLIDALNLYEIEQEVGAAFGWPVIAVDGAEGDDVIATLALKSRESLDDGSFFKLMNEEDLFAERSVIVSGDKDFGQLSDIIEIFDPKHHVFDKPDSKLALKTLILRGDSLDGIPSINCPDDYFASPHKYPRHPVTKKQFESLPEVLTEEIISATCPEKLNNYKRNDQLVNLRKIPVSIRQAVLSEFETQVHQLKATKPDPMAFCTRWGLLNLLIP